MHAVRRHELRFGRSVTDAESSGDGFVLRWRGTAVMGIINVTPDSFSDGGVYSDSNEAINAGRVMVANGALIVDVGGESTRPGAQPVPAEEELRRVLPVVEALAADGLTVSIDTSKAIVAEAALAAGASLVNDVGGLRDPKMRSVCAEAGAPAVLMHMRGNPAFMQNNPVYRDVVSEVAHFLHRGAELAIADGVPDIVLDPGIGFGKHFEQNRSLLQSLPVIAKGRPLLVGVSRKQLVARLTGQSDPAARDPGSIALHLLAASLGAAIVRVHNVEAHVQALRAWEGIRG
jgi:dihydropteroate synthase